MIASSSGFSRPRRRTSQPEERERDKPRQSPPRVHPHVQHPQVFHVHQQRKEYEEPKDNRSFTRYSTREHRAKNDQYPIAPESSNTNTRKRYLHRTPARGTFRNLPRIFRTSVQNLPTLLAFKLHAKSLPYLPKYVTRKAGSLQPRDERSGRRNAPVKMRRDEA